MRCGSDRSTAQTLRLLVARLVVLFGVNDRQKSGSQRGQSVTFVLSNDFTYSRQRYSSQLGGNAWGKFNM